MNTPSSKIIFRVDLPLKIAISSTKKFILNLNQYRNLHYRTLAAAKKRYAQIVYRILSDRTQKKISKKPLTIYYDYYHGNKRRHDVLNAVSVIDKFALDALVEGGLLEDDNSDIVKQYVITDRGIDKENPRAELRITEYKE